MSVTSATWWTASCLAIRWKTRMPRTATTAKATATATATWAMIRRSDAGRGALARGDARTRHCGEPACGAGGSDSGPGRTAGNAGTVAETVAALLSFGAVTAAS